MCAITGMIAYGDNKVDESLVIRLTESLSHRGPDGNGLWLAPNGRACLGHRRLAILDLSRSGDQPMVSRNGKYVIVYNGEVYNFIEIRQELIDAGEQITGESDTEVILAAWQRWGELMLDRFNGMWAFAIWDTEAQELFIARDRFGVKPFFYFLNDKHFIFGSELYSLRKCLSGSVKFNLHTCRRLLMDPFGVEAGISTIFEGICQLQAGHWAKFQDGKLTMRRWWCTANNLIETPTTAEARGECFYDIFKNAVNVRMRSDVPIGTCLSGGFDSTAVACTMARIEASGSMQRTAKSWRHAFVATFPGQDNDEREEAKKAAEFAGITPVFTEISNGDALIDIEKILWNSDGPYIGLQTAIWKIYRELRRNNIHVSLDGHGADELMGAYRQENFGIGYKIRQYYGALSTKRGAISSFADAARRIGLSSSGYCFLRGGWLAGGGPLRLLADNDELPREWGNMNRLLYRMFHVTVLPTILRNYDRLSMAHGIEVRMPFMDWRLVTYIMSLPAEAKADSTYTKLIARQAMKGKMPESIRMAKKKIGFNSPMPNWLNGPLIPWIHALFKENVSAFDEIVDTKRLKNRIDDLSNSKTWGWTSAGRLWPYINLRWIMGRLG